MGALRVPPAFVNFPLSYAEARTRGMHRAVCLHVVDGDTIDVLIDLGFFSYSYETIRLAAIDTPELSGADRERGLRAKDRTAELVLGKPVCLRTAKDATTFGRFVAEVFYQQEATAMWRSLADQLRDDGFVKQLADAWR